MISIEKEERPWGRFFVLHDEKNYKLKRIEVDPGGKLSYQFHYKRSEVWTIVEGKGKVTLNGKVRDYVFEAQKRGIVFDVGHGGGSFLFEQAVPAIKQGLKPDVISTDLHTGSMNGGMKNINNVMSKFLNMGLSIQEVIAATTSKPAKYLQRKDLGHLSVGGLADLTILNQRKGEFGFIDTRGKRMEGNPLGLCPGPVRSPEICF